MKRSYSLDKMSLKHVRIGLDAPWKMKVQRAEYKEEDQNVWQKKMDEWNDIWRRL